MLFTDIMMTEKIPDELKDEWQSYVDCCISLNVEPSERKFLKYNEYYKNYGTKSKSS